MVNIFQSSGKKNENKPFEEIRNIVFKWKVTKKKEFKESETIAKRTAL